MKYEIFHETLSAALSHILQRLTEERVELRDAEQLSRPFEFGGIPYETSKESHSEIATLKGKGTRKFAHLTIYRMQSGRYEVTFYLG